jgi:type IV fimbrial biogenesis protein FimT
LRKGRGKKGITLIELVVVMAIIAIMAAFMAPSIGEWVQNYRIKQAARSLASDFQFAKMQAISQHCYWTVAFQITVNGILYDYVMFPDADNDAVFNPAIDSANIFKQVILSNEYENVTFDTSQAGGGIQFNGNTIAFDSRGLPRDFNGNYVGGTVYLINTKNNRGWSIIVSSAGAINIAQYQ